ncbi:hypothetical protein GCM10010493_31110 [Streptomyces lavendulae subsp. grasserius]
MPTGSSQPSLPAQQGAAPAAALDQTAEAVAVSVNSRAKDRVEQPEGRPVGEGQSLFGEHVNDAERGPWRDLAQVQRLLRAAFELASRVPVRSGAAPMDEDCARPAVTAASLISLGGSM